MQYVIYELNLFFVQRRNADDPDTRLLPEWKHMDVESRFRNATVNFSAATGMKPAIRNLFRKANMQAASEDHAYLDRPITEY